jgi:hypothetical protein
MNFRADIITGDALLLEMFPSQPTKNLDECRITLEIHSKLPLRHVADQFRDLCAWRQARLVIGGKTVEQAVLPIARALRTARHARVAPKARLGQPG